MKNVVSILLLFLSIQYLNAQNNIDFYKNKYPNANEVVLKQISLLNISLSNNALDILEETTEESLVLTDDINKIATKGNVSFSTFNQLLNLDASTYYLNKKYAVKDFRIVPDKHSRSFHDDTKIKEFDYSQLGLGAVKKLNYKSKLTEPRLISGELFIENNPIEYKEFMLVADKNIEIGFKVFNNQKNLIQFKQEEKGNKIIYTWSAKDIPQYKYEEGMPSVLYFVPIVEVFVKSYKNKKGEKVNVLNSLEDLHLLYQDYTKDIYETPSEDLIAKAKELKAKHTNELDQVKEIYYWVKDNIKYIAFEDGYGGFIPRKPNDVFQKRYGDCKDMAVIIYIMLKSVNLENIYLTWIGSREKPFKYDELPTQAVDDHMIATYQYQGKNYFLDGTSKDTPFGYPSSFIQGKQAFIHKSKNQYELAMVPVVEASNNESSQEIMLTIQNQNIKGNSKLLMTGFYRDVVLGTLQENKGVEQTQQLKGFLELGNNKFQLDAFDLSNRENRDKPFEINYSFNIDNYIVTSDNEIFINLFLQKLEGFKELSAKREVDYHSDNAFAIKQVVKLNIPKGYKVNYIPENQKIDKSKYGFDIKYTKTNEQVILFFELKLNYLELKKEEIPDWNNFVNLTREYMAESISLTKI